MTSVNAASRRSPGAGRHRRPPRRPSIATAGPTTLAAVLTGLALIPPGTVPIGAVPAAGAIPLPPVPAGLPAGIEDLSPYQPQTTCDPAAKPGVVAFEHLLLRVYPDTGSDGIVRACFIGGQSEHKQGRAFDWQVDAADPRQAAEAKAVIDWLLAPDAAGHKAAMARRLGLMYIVWNRQIWGSYKIDEGWRPYTGADPHTGHVHFSFDWAGAREHTSYWTGRVAPLDPGPPGATTAPAGSAPAHDDGDGGPQQPLLRLGSTGTAVQALQQLFHLPVTSRYDERTRAAVLAWQQAHRLVADGVVGPKTWAALEAATTTATTQPASYHPAPRPPNPLSPYAGQPLRAGARGPAVAALQRVLHVSADGAFGPVTRAALVRYQQARHLPASGVTDAATWAALVPKPATGPTSVTFASTVTSAQLAMVRLHSTGPAVLTLQRLLGIAATGTFDAATRDAVVAFQKAHLLAPDGIVGPVTWAALRTPPAAKAPAPPPAQPLLRIGATGAAVTALQRLLHVGADGAFGPQTQAAVVAFQRSHHLAPDGVVGPATWAALR